MRPVCGRETQPESAAFARNARDCDRPAVSLDDVLHQAQPEPIAMNLSGDNFTSSIKGLEYVRQVRFRNPDTLVGDRDLYALRVIV